MTCNRRHLSVGVAVMDTFAGKEHFLWGLKLHHPVGWSLQYEFPGGKVEPNETAMCAAVREVYEETGLLVDPVFLGCYVETDNYLCLMFGALPIDGELKLKEPDKHLEWRWYPYDASPQPLIPYAEEGLRVISERHYPFHEVCEHRHRDDRFGLGNVPNHRDWRSYRRLVDTVR